MKRRRIQGWMLLGLALLVFSGCEIPKWGSNETVDQIYYQPNELTTSVPSVQTGSALPGFQPSPTLYLTSPATGFVPTPRPGMRIDPQLAIALREEHLRTPEQNIAVYKGYIDQVDPLPYHRLAVAQTQAGLYRDATKYFRYALVVAPDDPVILSDLGYCCYVQNALDDAEDILLMAARITPNDPRVNDKLAHVMAMEGRYDEAAIQFQQTMSPADAHAHLANACAVRGDHQAAQQWYAYSMNLSDVYRGPRMIATVPTPTVQVAAPPLYQQQAPPRQQMPPQFAQQQPVPGTQPYEAPRQDSPPFQSPLNPMNPESMAYQPGPAIENNPDTGLPARPQSPPSPFAQYGEASSGFASTGASQLPPQQGAGFAQVQEASPAPVERAPWDRDMSFFAEQPTVAMIPEQPNDSVPIGEASIGSSSSDGGRNAFLTYQSEESVSDPYNSSGRAPTPMTAPEGENPWSRTPSPSDDSSSYVPQSSASPYDDTYVFQAMVEEASPSQPRTFAPVERYDYEDVAPVPVSAPYEETNLADEINAALSPLLTIVEPKTLAAPVPYANFGEEPAVEYATFPTEVEVFVPE